MMCEKGETGERGAKSEIAVTQVAPVPRVSQEVNNHATIY